MLALKKLACGGAGGIQFGERHRALMSRNLKHAISGGIDDPVTGSNVLRSVLVQHGSTRRRLVAQKPASGTAGKLLHDLGWESAGIGGKGPVQNEAADLPVACGAVLTRARRLADTMCGARGGERRYAGKLSATTEPQSLQSGKCEAAHRASDITQRVTASVSVSFRINRRSDTDPVKDDDGSSAHHAFGTVCT